MKKVTLVLGAGSSIAMGYPVGKDLRLEIINLTKNKYKELIYSSSANIRPEHITDFVEHFQHSQMESIDAFLARRPEYVEIGKRAIAAILLDKENIRTIRTCEHADHWYRYFFNRMTGDAWEKLNFDNLSIITFNYDRSLEHYLAFAMMASYKKTFEEVCNKLRELQIIHVYGSLGPCHPNEPNYFQYGAELSVTNIAIAASKLKVIPEGRQDDATLDRARELLSLADSIGFLGFGFDDTNLNRLNSTITCPLFIQRDHGLERRQIFATCLGMTPAELNKVIIKTVGRNINQSELSNMFYQKDCLGMLRESLLLDQL